MGKVVFPKIGKTLGGWDRVGILRIDVHKAYQFPPFYGLAYVRWNCDKAVCYPIPLNWLVWILYNIWERLKVTPRSLESIAYNQGFREGYGSGYSEGINIRNELALKEEMNQELFDKLIKGLLKKGI